MVGNVVKSDFEILPFRGRSQNQDGTCSETSGWAENVIHNVTRDVGCQPGFNLTTDDNGQTQCMAPAPCEKCKGDPVEISSGQKRQRERDYESAAPGGLEFVRYYNSGGFFGTESSLQVNSDVWRHSYSSNIVPYTGNANVMAAVVRPSGVARFFNASGVEMQNMDGASYRLQKLTDGGGNVTGWTLTTDTSDVESYDSQGRLASITTRAGFVTTLSYDAQGNLSTASDAFGRGLTFGYDAQNRLVTMTDPSSRVYQYGYDATGRLASVTYPDTQHTDLSVRERYAAVGAHRYRGRARGALCHVRIRRVRLGFLNRTRGAGQQVDVQQVLPLRCVAGSCH